MTNEQLALRIKAGEDVADNMLQLYQQIAEQRNRNISMQSSCR